MTKTETPHTESYEYELYVLGSESKFILYGCYEVNSEDIYCIEKNGNVITTYHTTGDTRIIFASNGITVISPKGRKESFTQGYMWRG